MYVQGHDCTGHIYFIILLFVYFGHIIISINKFLKLDNL